MNEFVTKVIFVENEVDKACINNNLKSYGLLYAVDVGGNYISKTANDKNTNKKSIYIVKPMDTILTIAKKLNMTKDEVLSLTNGHNVFVGQQIVY